VIERVLLAVDDSPDSLAAARLAVDLAARLRAQLRAVHVTADHVLTAAFETATGRPATGRGTSAEAILAHITRLAAAAQIDVQTELLDGDIVPAVLDAAQSWRADLLVVGKSTRTATGASYVGTQTRHLLEFADLPVLVVPHA
jgi:nucleotide-binding universal stress UspA family protein